MIELLAALEVAFPVKRKLEIEGWPGGLYLWRLESQQVFELMRLPHASAEEMIPYSLRECQLGIGDENGPGVFDNERGRSWLLRHPSQMVDLAKAVREFNELCGASEERKKKSEPNQSEPCSPCHESLDTDTLGI